MGQAQLRGVGLTLADVVDSHIVQVILQAALDGVAAGLFDLAAPALDVIEGDAQSLADLFSRLLTKAAVLLDDHLYRILVGHDLLKGLITSGIHKLLGKHDVDEVLAQITGQTSDLGATAELILGGALLVAPLCRAGIGHDQIALFAAVDDHGSAHAAGRSGGDINGRACGQLRQHDTLQGSSVVVSSGADFLCCKGQLNRLSQLHVASCGSNTACRSSRGRGGSCRRSSSLSTGSHAGAACHSSSCTNHTCDLQEISASDLFHNPFLLFSWGFVVRTRLCLSTFFCGVAAFHSLCSFMLSKLYSIRSAVAR